MLNKKEIIEEMERLFALKDMVESYEEIAASRMRRIRDSVLQTRDYLLGINQVFHQVQSSYKTEITKLMKEKKIKDPSKITFLKRNGKTAFVLLSANTGLYGGIIKKTFNLFLENLKKENADVILIGKLGKGMYEQEKLPNPVTYFELADNKIDPEIFKQIMAKILEYERIIVFHGLFQTVITQKPVMSNISGGEVTADNVQSSVPKDISLKDALKGTSASNTKYLFEPDLSQIMAFFETEIFGLIFEQTLHESELAKFSSRMVVLDQAVDNIRGTITKTKSEYSRVKHSKGNRKQLSRLSGMTLWRKEY